MDIPVPVLPAVQNLPDFFNKNLIKNPCGDEGFKYWMSTGEEPKDRTNVHTMITNYKENISKARSNWRYDFKIEEEQNGVKEKSLFASDGKTLVKNFVTSHTIGRKYQVIELDDNLIGELKPQIEISENWTERFDCGAKYFLSVLLVDSTYQIVDWFKFEKIMPQWSDANWKLESHVFEVKAPVKYILFYHAGSDTQDWAGQYGSKMTNASVRILI